MKPTLLLGLVLVVCFVSSGCQSETPALPAAFSESDRAAIREMGSSWATNANAGNFSAVASLYTEDALLLPPNAEAIQGRSAIESLLASFPPTSFQTEALEIDGAGDIAFVRGTYSLTSTPEGAPPSTDRGKYLEIWRKQSDGSWKLARDMFNSDVPLPSPSTPPSN